MNDLPDIQLTKPIIEIPIAQVGVENVEVPFSLISRDENEPSHRLIANVSMRSNLKGDRKGISMSRFVRTLRKYLGTPLKHKMIHEILKDLKNNLECDDVYMKFHFKFPKMKKSPWSDNEFPLYYKCRFEGQLINNHYRFFQGVIVQYASYCPCSNELCNHLKENGSNGFPHAQRSFANILVETQEPNYVWLEDIIDDVEGAIKTLPYPIIKRVDEQRIAEIAASNPIFVEDAIRQISQALDNNKKYYDWLVSCVHEESIHTSEAIAINWKGISNGFNGNFYL